MSEIDPKLTVAFLDEIRMPECIEQLAQEAKYHDRLVDLSTDA